MRTIAILCGRFLPGYKDGGPVRTLVNLVECLGKEYRFKIITNDRDHGETKRYEGIKYNEPNFVGNAEVWYLAPGGFHHSVILELTKDADAIYVCGPYGDYAYKTMLLKRINKIKQPVTIAAMGSFSKGAIQIKGKKKKLYLTMCKILGLFKNVNWSVTSALEENDVKRIIGYKVKCITAEDLPREVRKLELREREQITKVVFISRICEMKNLLYAIEILSKITCEIYFDIYGILEDVEYWGKCHGALEQLPDNVKWEYKGIAESEKVVDIFSEYDIFLFPTRGENFGHVIFEALSGGCIPIISNQTPWNDLESFGCGRVIELERQDEFVKEIERIAKMSESELRQKKKSANNYAMRKYRNSMEHTGYRKIFG